MYPSTEKDGSPGRAAGGQPGCRGRPAGVPASRVGGTGRAGAAHLCSRWQALKETLRESRASRAAGGAIAGPPWRRGLLARRRGRLHPGPGAERNGTERRLGSAARGSRLPSGAEPQRVAGPRGASRRGAQLRGLFPSAATAASPFGPPRPVGAGACPRLASPPKQATCLLCSLTLAGVSHKRPVTLYEPVVPRENKTGC